MKIGLYFRKRIDHLIRMANNIATFVLAHGSEVFVAPEIVDLLPQYPAYCSSDQLTKPDALLSLGGDGTFLHAAQYALLQDIPIIGINFGFTGFLTTGAWPSRRYATRDSGLGHLPFGNLKTYL